MHCQNGPNEWHGSAICKNCMCVVCSTLLVTKTPESEHSDFCPNCLDVDVESNLEKATECVNLPRLAEVSNIPAALCTSISEQGV